MNSNILIGDATMPKVVIKIDKVSKIYDNKVKALNNVSLEIYEKEIFSLLGPNGAGKTTLIKIITGQLKPSSGELWILGVSHKEFLNSSVRHRVNFVPQENVIWEKLTVEENMMLMASMYKIPRREAREKVKELMEEFELLDTRKRLASKLSGGMRRKLAIAMALINDPDILILDEPTAGLDPRMRAILLGDIEKLKRKGKTILLTTHIVEEAERLSDRVGIIHRGEIITVDDPSSLKAKACGSEVLDLLFRKIDDVVLEAVVRIINGHDYIKVGDKILIKGDNLLGILNELRKNKLLYDSMLNASIRKSTLEDAFLFLTGTMLGE